jgi:hypothetical protein
MNEIDERIIELEQFFKRRELPVSVQLYPGITITDTI